MEKKAKEALRKKARSLPDLSLLEEGRRHFDAGRFFEAHEVWEELWRRMRGTEREGVQGLVQVAVAFAHARRGNEAGFRSVMARGLANLGRARNYRGLDLAEPARAAREALDGPFPPTWPRLGKAGWPRG